MHNGPQEIDQRLKDAALQADVYTVGIILTESSNKLSLHGLMKALEIAAQHGNLQVINRLLDFERVQENIAKYNNWALRIAAINDQPDVVNRLLDFQAVKENAAVNNNEVLRYAIDKGYIKLFKRLQGLPAIQETLAAQVTSLLCLAVVSERLNMVNCLLELRVVEDNLAKVDMWTLCCAIKLPNLAIFNRLYEFQAIQNTVAVNQNELLCYAAENGKLDAMNGLVHIGGKGLLQVIKNKHSKVYLALLNERLAIACATLSLIKSRSLYGRSLPYPIRHKILSFAYHPIVCGQQHGLVTQKAGKGETLCDRVNRFISTALKEYEAQIEYEKQHMSLFKKLRKYLGCGL